MHLLFLDESGQLAERKLFALGGIALRDSDRHELRDCWQTTLVEHGWLPERELKWHGIRTGEVPPALADAVVAALSRAPVTCYVTPSTSSSASTSRPTSSPRTRTRTRPRACSSPSASSSGSRPRRTSG